ncbi:MAG: LemA family protein [Ketobacter sp.]|nr:MAG: LemA family protein [Ketobacter sp.]
MDAKDRVEKMLQDGVINNEQARRLRSSIGDDEPALPVQQSSRRLPYGWIGLGVALLTLLLAVLFQVNSMISAREQLAGAEAALQSQYQRRHDLIPQLIQVVKTYLEHEQSTLLAVTQARSQPAADLRNAVTALAQQVAAGAAGKAYSDALFNLFAVAEQYPTLRASDQFLSLQAQIEGTENRINVARLKLSNSAMEYNSQIKRYPKRWIADWMGYEPADYFSAVDGAEQPPPQNW